MEASIVILSGAAVVYSISSGIASAIFTSQNNESRHECGPAIWYNLLMFCIFSFVGPIMTYNRSDEQDGCFTKIIQLAITANWIWGFVSLYHTSSDCMNLFEENYPNVILMLKIHVYAPIAFMVATIIVICFARYSLATRQDRINVVATTGVNVV